MEINEYGLREGYFLRTKQLSDTQKNRLIQIFDEVGEQEFPSIIDQLKHKFAGRLKIDREILKAFGANDEQSSSFLESIYDIMADELVQLKSMVSGPEAEADED